MIIKEITSKDWVWFWSGNWPLLDCIYQRDPLFQEEFRMIMGDYPRVSLDIYKDGVLTAYHTSGEYSRLGRLFLEVFSKRPSFIQESFRCYGKRTRKDITRLARISGLDLKTLTNSRLAELFRFTRALFRFNSTYDHYCWYLEKFLHPVLQRFLERRIGDKSRMHEYLAALVTPHKGSRVYQERCAFFSMVRSLKGDRSVVDCIKRDDDLHGKFPYAARMIEDHARKYGYLVVLVNNPPLSYDDVIKEVRKYVLDNKSFTIDSVRIGDSYDPGARRRSEKIIRMISPPKKIRLLIQGLRETSFIRTEDNAVMSLSSYLIAPLFEEIAVRLGITYHDLKFLVPEEIICLLRYHQKADMSRINDRKTLCVHYVDEKDNYLFTGKNARAVCNALHSRPCKASELKGTPASSGKTVGTAFVAKSSVHETKLFREGDILVAPATSADFVPIMRKASAVVTEMGGLTSHAAIVSREFRVPCVVGVSGATSSIMTGDIIEVDAGSGMIRKIK